MYLVVRKEFIGALDLTPEEISPSPSSSSSPRCVFALGSRRCRRGRGDRRRGLLLRVEGLPLVGLEPELGPVGLLLLLTLAHNDLQRLQ